MINTLSRNPFVRLKSDALTLKEITIKLYFIKRTKNFARYPLAPCRLLPVWSRERLNFPRETSLTDSAARIVQARTRWEPRIVAHARADLIGYKSFCLNDNTYGTLGGEVARACNCILLLAVLARSCISHACNWYYYTVSKNTGLASQLAKMRKPTAYGCVHPLRLFRLRKTYNIALRPLYAYVYHI